MSALFGRVQGEVPPGAYELNRVGPVPLYRQIARILRERIARGELVEDDALPSVPELVKWFGVAKKTAVKALRVLRQEDVAYLARGCGTFVGRWYPGRPLPRTRHPHRMTLYRMIADEVVENIREGSYLPHEALPSEIRMMRTHQVSRSTVRRAVGFLRHLGWVYTVPQIGSFPVDEEAWP
ncbi:GntR family transcriptional regulator [Acrocarpospora catenulata]|uniref:GntR family transcriptional regulator n=1 Tax=Acrocarpospora catenulata TaxID=2836182 RepID=UPI001BD9F821|nr:GntR family transcriptional regulator [Acrocarpospora catenulata]